MFIFYYKMFLVLLFCSIKTVLIGPEEMVIESVLKNNHFVGFPCYDKICYNETARALYKNTPITNTTNIITKMTQTNIITNITPINNIIVRFIQRKDSYLIKFNNGRFLCGKDENRNPAVIMCREENDPNTWWTISSNNEGKFALKAKGGKCLRAIAIDKRIKTKGYFLHLKKCNGNKDYSWIIKMINKTEPEKLEP
ncbi:hypothetical protein M153_13851000587, partial [Pseudoloma neurophilia]